MRKSSSKLAEVQTFPDYENCIEDAVRMCGNRSNWQRVFSQFQQVLVSGRHFAAEKGGEMI